MNPVQIALVGQGSMANACLERIRRCTDAVLVARVQPESGWQQSDVQVWDSLDDGLLDPAVEALVLAVGDAELVPMALRCIAAGKGVLLERPGYLDCDEAALLQHALEMRQVPCLPGFYRLHSPVYQVARKALDNHLLGRLSAVQGHWRFFSPSDFHRAAEWRTARMPLQLLDHLAHEIACLRFLLGEIIEVQALRSQDTDCGSYCVCVRFESGVLGTLLLADLDHSGQQQPCYQDEDQCVLTGSEGALSLPDMTLRRYGLRQSGEDWSPFTSSQLDVRRRDPMMEQLRHFCRVVRGEQEALVDIGWAIRNARVLEALKASCGSGEPQPVRQKRSNHEVVSWLRNTAALAAVS